MPLLIAARELSDLLTTSAPVRLLDVRWRLDRPEGRPDYLDGHLPGAVYVDFDEELAERGDPRRGRHPLPSRERLQDAARRWGLHPGDTVVVYDDVQSVAAARAWWLLTRSGVADVRVLDGGLRAWIADGFALEFGDVQPPRGTIELDRIPEESRIDIDQAEAWPRRGVLLDVRAADRYRGDVEPHDPVAGHIPGAVNLPTTQHLHAGRFRSPEEIRATFAAAGAAPGTAVAAYCGSGVAASHTVLAGAIAGIEVILYPGSWSEWSRSRRYAAVGQTPARVVTPV